MGEVIEGDYFTDYDRFVECYLNPDLCVRDIQVLLGIGPCTYRTVQKELVEAGRITMPREVVRKRGYDGARYYYRTPDGNFYIKHDGVYYGRCDTEREAQLIVEQLKHCNWNRYELARIRRDVLGESVFEDFDRFVELYNNHSISVNELKERMGLSRYEYRRYWLKAKTEGLLDLRSSCGYRRKFEYRDVKNYHWVYNNGYSGYQVRKWGVYYCTCRTEEEAKKVVERLRECDWDKSMVEKIKLEVCG